jgi:hypothetical protein
MLDAELASKAVPGESCTIPADVLTELVAQGDGFGDAFARVGSKVTVSTESTVVPDSDDIDIQWCTDFSRQVSTESTVVPDSEKSYEESELVSAVRSAMGNLSEEPRTPVVVTSANAGQWKSPSETLILALRMRQGARSFTLEGQATAPLPALQPTRPASAKVQTNVRSPKAPDWNSPLETLIILDWDDTLCPTSSCKHIVQTARMSPMENEMLEVHEAAVIDFLKRASKLGHCVIVTMAVTTWVTQCIAKLMPRVGDLLQALQIEVVSARESFVQRLRRSACSDDRDPNQYLKTKAMQRVIKQFYKRGGRQRMGMNTSRAAPWKHITSIGDADGERFALQDLVFQSQWSECRCKTLLLLDTPSLGELTREVRYLTAALPALIARDGDLHVDMNVNDELVGLVEAVETGQTPHVVEMALDLDVLSPTACTVLSTASIDDARFQP